MALGLELGAEVRERMVGAERSGMALVAKMALASTVAKVTAEAAQAVVLTAAETTAVASMAARSVMTKVRRES